MLSKEQEEDLHVFRNKAHKLTLKIVHLTKHIARFPDDSIAKRSLFRSIARRRRALEHIQSLDPTTYVKVIELIKVQDDADD